MLPVRASARHSQLIHSPLFRCVFSGKGAVFNPTLGQPPQGSLASTTPALKARFSIGSFNRRIETRFQRLVTWVIGFLGRGPRLQ